jgi:hypothetical protein
MLRAVLAHAEGAPLGLAEATALTVRWLAECDRGAPLEDGVNEMHAAGMALCKALSVHEVPVPMPEAAVGLFVTPDFDVRSCDVRALQEFVCGLQAEFCTLYEASASGFDCRADVTAMLLAVLQRLGFWLRFDFKTDDLTLHGVVDADADGWGRVRIDVVRSLLDGTHAMLGLHRMLLQAERVAGAGDVELHPVHLEASMDTWWELANVADCPIGAITQYKHSFQYLFHSVSQVVYYHFPAYTRRPPAVFADVVSGRCEPLQALPLLLQVAPEVPVLYEHTGAGHAASMRGGAWCVLAQFVLRVTADGRVLCASDCRALAV